MSEDTILKKVDEKFEELAAMVQIGFEETHKRIDSLDEKVSVNTQKINLLDKKVASNGKSIDELNEKLEQRFLNIVPRADMYTVQDTLKTHDNRITRLEENALTI